MRVAVLQIALDPKRRAQNVQRISAAIDATADTDPAPDLIVLPGACDTGGTVGGRGFSDASLTAVRERIAFKAKEWGVYIAVGLHRRRGDSQRDARGDSLEPWNVLIDPDGDVAADTWHYETGAPDSGSRFWGTPLGRVGVGEVSAWDETSTAETEVSADGAVVVLPIARSPVAKVRHSLEAIVADLRSGRRGGGACWVVVASAADPEGSDAMRSFIRGTDGTIVAEADAMGERVLRAELVPAEP